MRGGNFVHWLQEQINSYNLFVPDEDDEVDDELKDAATITKQQKYATWLYVILFIIFLSILLVISLVTPQTRVVTVSNISPSLFKQLRAQHGETLSCPCSTITVPYDTFIANIISFHPICSSVFVSGPWIDAFYLADASVYLAADFRTTAYPQFKLLADLCLISNDTATEALNDINNLQFVTLQVLDENDLQTQIDSSIELIRTTVLTQVSSIVNLIQIISRSNTFVSALNTNTFVRLKNGVVYIIEIENMAYEIENATSPDDWYYSNCAYESPVVPAGFYSIKLTESRFTRKYWSQNSSGDQPLATTMVNGFFGGCTSLDALLASTLDCLYDVECLKIFADYFPNLNQTNFNWNNSVLSSSKGGGSVNDYVSNLFIDQWLTKINYTNYFHQCAPLYCTYSTTDQTSFSHTITLLLSLYGGLTAILRLIAPFLIDILSKLKRLSIKTTKINCARCLTLFRKLLQWVKQLNIFKSATNRTVDDIKQQRIITRTFLFLLTAFSLVLILFTSFNTQTVTMIVPNVTLTTYTNLQTLHSTTLKCPCSNMIMPYKSFLSLSPSFHQICSSDLVSNKWISLLEEFPEAPGINKWLIGTPRYYQLLLTLCQLANKTADDNIRHFIVRTIVTSHVLTQTDFNTQFNTTVTQFIQSTLISFKLSIDTMRIFIHVDQLFTVSDGTQLFTQSKGTNVLIIPTDIQFLTNDIATGNIDSQAPRFIFRLNGISINNSNSKTCICATDTYCEGSIILDLTTKITFSGISRRDVSNNPTSYVAPGMIKSCFTFDSAILSTLECFYSDSTCLSIIIQTVDIRHPFSNSIPLDIVHSLVDNGTSTSFPPKMSLSLILAEMMIDQWNIQISFEQYYAICAPIYCTYTQTINTKSFGDVLITFISLIGGLTVALRIITPPLVKFIFRLFYPIANQPQQVRRKLFDQLKALVRNLVTFLHTKLVDLNLFPQRAFGSNIDRITVKYYGQWSTRLYIILLIISLAILTLHTIIQPETLTKTFVKPSLNDYNLLIAGHSDTLQCPCSFISSPYNRYVQIEPIFHQVCSSIFVSDNWRTNLTMNLVPDLSVYNQTDYRRFLSAHLQFLQGLCELSIQSVNDTIRQSLSSLLITNQLLTKIEFKKRIDVLIDESKSDSPSMLNRFLFLLRKINHANGIISTYGTNYEYYNRWYIDVLSFPYALPIIYDNNCSCSFNATCNIQASFHPTNAIATIPIKGLKMGCTPSESFLASTLECFYNLSCINRIQEMTNMSIGNTPNPLEMNKSRFSINLTVSNLVSDLFVESWSTILNYSLYFDQCSPVVCSYTYVQQLNSFYTIAYLLGLYGGLTIVLKWICPRIISLIAKAHQYYKKRRNLIVPTSTLEMEANETVII